MSPSLPERLLDDVSRFETHLETPTPPGEGDRWRDELAQFASAVQQQLLGPAAIAEREILTDMVQFDPAMRNRALRLETEGAALRQEFDAYCRQVKQLQQAEAERVENDPRGQQAVTQLRARGLELVLRIRIQERSLSTWHAESLQRDRGLSG